MISRKYNEKSNVTGLVIQKLRKSQKMSRATLSNKLMSMCQVNVGNFFIFFSNPLNAIASTLY